MAPYTYNTLMPLLQTSAKAAAQQCTGTATGFTGTSIQGEACGLQWTKQAFDGSSGPGEQMAAMEVFLANLIDHVPSPVTGTSGGTSKGNPGAGSGVDANAAALDIGPVTTGDRVGAGFITTLILVGVLAGAWWMVA